MFAKHHCLAFQRQVVNYLKLICNENTQFFRTLFCVKMDGCFTPKSQRKRFAEDSFKRKETMCVDGEFIEFPCSRWRLQSQAVPLKPLSPASVSEKFEKVTRQVTIQKSSHYSSLFNFQCKHVQPQTVLDVLCPKPKNIQRIFCAQTKEPQCCFRQRIFN